MRFITHMRHKKNKRTLKDSLVSWMCLCVLLDYQLTLLELPAACCHFIRNKNTSLIILMVTPSRPSHMRVCVCVDGPLTDAVLVSRLASAPRVWETHLHLNTNKHTRTNMWLAICVWAGVTVNSSHQKSQVLGSTLFGDTLMVLLRWITGRVLQTINTIQPAVEYEYIAVPSEKFKQIMMTLKQPNVGRFYRFHCFWFYWALADSD